MKNEEVTIIEHRGKKIKLSKEAIEKLYELQFGFDDNHPEVNEGIEENLNYLHELYDFLIQTLDNSDITKSKILRQMQSLYYMGQFFRTFEYLENERKIQS
ncbi:MAG: hypothetical protein L3J54_04255 [Draconibacterium sp.]|nr:hypothetical protein [Draconibacterium sp.]